MPVSCFPPKPPPDYDPCAKQRAEVKDFVSNFDFPRPRGVVIPLCVPEEDIAVFMFSYGKPRDCPVGCIYSSAYGIKNGSKIGWILFVDGDGFDYSNVEMYDFDENDEYLYTDEFFNELEDADDWIYYSAFVPALAKDPDTSEEALLRIAEYLFDVINPKVARSLLENPSVQQNARILKVLAKLPVYPNDAYREVKSDAEDLLDALEQG